MIHAAIIGLGRWGRILVDSVQGKSGALRFTKAVVRTPERHGEFAARHGILLVATSEWRRVLADSGIEAVVLATPHSQHVAQIKEAAAAGKHVFVEKPLALTRAGAEQAAAAAERAGVVLAVGYNRRFSPLMAELRTRIAGGDLGAMLHLEANFSLASGFDYKPESWRADPAESPAGGMTGMGVHMIDAMISVAGPVELVWAQTSRRVLEIPMDDTTVMLFRFRNGITGYLGTMTATAPLWRLQAFATRGWIEIFDETKLRVRRLDGTEEGRVLPALDSERAELEAFAVSIAKGTPYLVDVADALHGAAVLEAVLRSSAENAPVAIA